MAIVDIPAQPTSWPNPDQYIQAVIDANPADTHYRLQVGVHRMQSMQLKQDDIFELQVGAILRGSEDASESNGVTWTADGGNWWASFSDFSTVNGNFLTGYANWREWPIVDGQPLPFVDDIANIDPTTCFYDDAANRLYINLDPTGADVEIARQRVALSADDLSVTGCQVFGAYAEGGVFENYASGAQSENAGIKIGRNGGDTVPNAAWDCHDIIIRNFRGMSIAHGDACTLERIVCHNTGQLGIGGSSTSDGDVRTSYFYLNGMGGWSSAWEAGNSKWARTTRQTVAGCFFDTADVDGNDNPNTELTGSGPLWFDIDNDGSLMYGNIIADRGHIGGRGLFWEISWSAKMYHNIMFQLGWHSENTFWSDGVIVSTSSVPPTSIFSAIEIFNNWIYQCGGGIKGIMQDRGTGDKAPYTCDDMRVYENMTQMLDTLDYPAFTGRGVTGTDGSSNVGTIWGTDIQYDKNIYITQADNQSWWRADGDMAQGGGGSEGWASWQSDGMDLNGEWRATSDSPMDQLNPFNGGVL